MPIAVAGSIATDHLMHFPGSSPTRCCPTSCTGCRCRSWSTTWWCAAAGSAPNICFGMAQLGLQADPGRRGRGRLRRLQSWLTGNGVDCTKVHLCPDVQTARFVCTTDDEMNQIASFYAGAMARAREIEIEPIAAPTAGWTWW